MSFIEIILNPLACNARKAVSLPDPGPFTSTSNVFNPYSDALEAASSAATCAAYGVDFLDPLNPLDPEDDQDNTFPFLSVIEIIVLLNVALTYAFPEVTIFFSFFLLLNLVFFFYFFFTHYFLANVNFLPAIAIAFPFLVLAFEEVL